MVDPSTDLQPQLDILRIRNLLLRDECADRTRGVESLGDAPAEACLGRGLLTRPVRHVEDQHVAPHVIQGRRLGDGESFLADDDAQLHFVV